MATIYRIYNEKGLIDASYDGEDGALGKFGAHARDLRDGYASELRMTVQRGEREVEIMRMTGEAMRLITNDENWKAIRETYMREGEAHNQ